MRENTFKQQTLSAWRPVPSDRKAMGIFSCFGLFFIIAGAALNSQNGTIKDASVRYDND